MTLARIAIALGITLVLALIVAGLSPPGDLGRNFALLIGALMALVLVGSGTLHQYEGKMGEAIRNLLIWGGLIALVAVLYASKSSFGF